MNRPRALLLTVLSLSGATCLPAALRPATDRVHSPAAMLSGSGWATPAVYRPATMLKAGKFASPALQVRRQTLAPVFAPGRTAGLKMQPIVRRTKP